MGRERAGKHGQDRWQASVTFPVGTLADAENSVPAIIPTRRAQRQAKPYIYECFIERNKRLNPRERIGGQVRLTFVVLRERLRPANSTTLQGDRRPINENDFDIAMRLTCS